MSMGFDDPEEDGSLDEGLRFILAAAFAFFTILFFIIVFYCYTRRLRSRQQRRRFHQDQLVYQIRTQIAPLDVDAEARSPTPTNHDHRQGLDPSVIALLPKLAYKQTERFRQAESIECSVCLATIVEDATVRILPNCKHLFHVDCVDKWFGSNTTCPICRTVAEPRVRAGAGVVQPTAPPAAVQEGNDDNEVGVGEVGGSGLRVTSFRSMVNRERSLRRDHGSDASATIEDIERL